MKLRPMSTARFLDLSEGIPDYTGPKLEQYRALMIQASDAIDSGRPSPADRFTVAEVIAPIALIFIALAITCAAITGGCQ